MKNKLLLFCITLLLVLPIVAAKQLPQESCTLNEKSITVVYSKVFNIPIDSNVLMPFDILNSTFFRLTNSTTSCVYFVISNIGGDVTHGDLIYSNTLNYWYFNLSSTDTKAMGDYNFYVHCNNTQEAGFVSLDYRVLKEGQYQSEITAVPTLLALAIVIFFLLFLTNILPEVHFILKLLLIGISLWLLILVPSATFLGFNLQVIFYKNVLWIVRVIMLYWFIYFMYEVLKFKGIIKQK